MIQQFANEMEWAFSKLGRSTAASPFMNESQGFLRAFADAAIRADSENYALLRPVLWKLMDKYPLKTKENPHDEVNR